MNRENGSEYPDVSYSDPHCINLKIELLPVRKCFSASWTGGHFFLVHVLKLIEKSFFSPKTSVK